MSNVVRVIDVSRELDEFVVQTVTRAIYEFSESLGVEIAWMRSEEATTGQSLYPGRNFAVMKKFGGMVHWTVWMSERNQLLNEKSLRAEVHRNLKLALQPLVKS